MESKDRISLIALTLFAQLFSSAPIHTEPIQVSGNASEQEIFLSLSVPQKDRLTLLSIVPIKVEGNTVGGLAAYDDATTQRAADYLELYNLAGDLLAVSWFDRFGIQRMAVDRGLLEEGNELQGVFVILLEEDSI